jgi:dimethylhistidine N-methyltransferase
MLSVVARSTISAHSFRVEVIAGLSRPQKKLSSRWLYDDRGSALFEAITRLREYYPTRTETAILRHYSSEIADFCGDNAILLEYGAGAGTKTEILIGALKTPQLYVPIDVAGNVLISTAGRIRRRFPQIEVRPVVGDFTTNFEISAGIPEERRVAFFPGSTIGNMDAVETMSFLRLVRRHVGHGGRSVIGVDLKKNVNTLIAAYDDRKGVTAAFNLNLLSRINRELAGDFRLDRFAHEARWNEAESAIEMHIVSLEPQVVRIGDHQFSFKAGETVHTESSRKYDIETFGNVVERCNWHADRVWTDPAARFAVFGLGAAR